MSKGSNSMLRKRKRQPKERAKKRHNCRSNDDRISRLPDDILVDILSLLPLDEAARTSVLSSRWINLWKYSTRLHLDGDDELVKLLTQYATQYRLIEREGRKYVSWVNRVLRSHKALTLKEFRIRFALDITDHTSITRWLHFAFARKVERLELDFEIDSHYHFPEYIIYHRRRMVFDFKSLTSLIFRNVHVSAGAIKLFLRNCPLLEQLIVCYSRKLSNLQVCGSSLVLKHLEIVYCQGLNSLRVSAPSLTYFKAATYDDELVLENIPRLVELDVNRSAGDVSMRGLFSSLTCCSELETLRLFLLDQGEETNKLCQLPQLPNVKKLFVTYRLRGSESLIRLTDLMRASPCLEEFVIQCQRGCSRKKYDEVEDAAITTHHHLKLIKFSGYCGQTRDLEFIDYILENCVVLEKLIIEHSCALASTNTIDVEQTARKNAKLLEALVPQHIELVIL